MSVMLQLKDLENGSQNEMPDNEELCHKQQRSDTLNVLRKARLIDTSRAL